MLHFLVDTYMIFGFLWLHCCWFFLLTLQWALSHSTSFFAQKHLVSCPDNIQITMHKTLFCSHWIQIIESIFTGVTFDDLIRAHSSLLVQVCKQNWKNTYNYLNDNDDDDFSVYSDNLSSADQLLESFHTCSVHSWSNSIAIQFGEVFSLSFSRSPFSRSILIIPQKHCKWVPIQRKLEDYRFYLGLRTCQTKRNGFSSHSTHSSM